jgi:hypothetical protein
MQKPSDIFTRLAMHDISGDQYGMVKQIVSFGLPQMLLLYTHQYGHRSIAQVIRQIDQWKELLRKDCVLSETQRSELLRTILGAEAVVWNALIEANLPRVGPWELRMEFVPTSEDESGQPRYIHPPVRITAVNRETQEVREAIIPYSEPTSSSVGDAYRRAFKELGLYDLTNKGFPAHGLVSARKPQGWPIFTRFVIPNLYEFLLPHYQKAGHYSEKREQTPELARAALYPQELLEDMVDILKLEHRSWFADYTVGRLKAVIQRHLDRKDSSTKSAHSAARS